MSRAAFRQVDVVRAVAAAQKAGLKVLSVEIRRDGTIQVNTDLTAVKGGKLNAWDKTCAAAE